MSQRTTYYPLGGGLDLITPSIAVKPGRAISAVNYEPHATGFQRIEGYERFDGRTSPTDAFDAAADETQGAIDRDAARAAIQAVPGSGMVRGVWHYGGSVYAFRDNVGATAGAMWKSSGAGWTAVELGFTLDFTSGGTTEPLVGQTIRGATSLATAVITGVVVESGDWTTGDAAGYFTMATATGTFVAENVDIVSPAAANVATIAGDKVAITLPAGGRYDFITHNFYASSGSSRMYGCNGVGRAFEFDGTTFIPIRTGMAADTPHRIAVHRQHLFLAFPGGGLVNSETGKPLEYEVIEGAAQYGVGSEITDLISANAGILTILAEASVSNLYGSSRDDFQLETISDESGALAWTADKVGEPIYMDARGIRRLSATQAFGNFQIGTLTRDIEPLMKSITSNGIAPTASVRVRSKDHYRIFFDDQTGLALYFGKKNVEVMPFNLGRVVRCICSAETSGGERIYFGSDDGYVYQLDKGRSFDGGVISYAVRLAFNHLGSPQQMKRWHKLVLECQATVEATIAVSVDFDYADPTLLSAPAVDFTIMGGGGFWDSANWNEFDWSTTAQGTAEAYLDGIGKNMSLLIAGETADEAPHLLQGVTLFFTPRGLQR